MLKFTVVSSRRSQSLKQLIEAEPGVILRLDDTHEGMTLAAYRPCLHLDSTASPTVASREGVLLPHSRFTAKGYQLELIYTAANVISRGGVTPVSNWLPMHNTESIGCQLVHLFY